MHNGKEKQLMTERLKKKIKHNAAVRRGKSRIQSITRELDDNSGDADRSDNQPSQSPLQIDEETHWSPPGFLDEQFVSVPTSPSSADPAGRSGQYPSEAHIPGTGPTSTPNQSDFESSLLMSYFDYAFPVLFPFYKPSILEGGRAWLLTLALKHTAAYHNVVGLAAYFYCAVPVLPGPENDACAGKAQTELQVHMEKAVRDVRDSLRDVTQNGIHHSLPENIILLGNAIQLVNFEVVFASSENWQIHLAAATDLFDQTLMHHGGGHQGTSMMGNMLEKLRHGVPENCSVWSAEQAALRFFAATMIYQSIIASTAHEETPKLFRHYSELLASFSNAENPDLLKLEDFVGCQTWVLRSIAEISSLNEWKKEAKHNGSLDVMDLAQRASLIQIELCDGAARLCNAATDLPLQTHGTSPYQPLETILAKSNINRGQAPLQSADSSLISRIWVYAAQIYLVIVLSGWQPGNVQLRSHVAQALDLLRTIDNPSWLRSLAWPICITGCFASNEQEQAFRSVTNASGGLAMFGTLRDALAIMEKVWSQRHLHNADIWDIGYCLRILGHSVLLV